MIDCTSCIDAHGVDESDAVRTGVRLRRINIRRDGWVKGAAIVATNRLVCRESASRRSILNSHTGTLKQITLRAIDSF
jgi:hypothetical protein